MSLGVKTRRVLNRLLQAVPTIFGILVVCFLLTRALPGDPAAYFAGDMADEASIEQVRENLGLNQSTPIQFINYVSDLAHGDLGVAISTGQTVTQELAKRLPASLELTLAALLLSLVIAIPLGVLAATRPNTWVDHLCRFLVTAGVSLPTFFTGLALLYVFYYLLGWAPPPIGRLDMMFLPPETVTGFYTIDSLIAGDWTLFKASLAQMTLPVITLALFTLAPIARMTRAAMLQTLSSDYVRTARAAGLSGRRVLVTYAFRNALLPVVTTLGMVFSFVLGANVLVEKVFAWPGIGSFAVEALVVSDYAAVQGFVLSMALLFVSLNLLIDLAYTLIDPRVAEEE
ncbi:peptide ABC transporter permease [Marinobacter psychrophilus]|uniref:Peptide ABC transporter permease n=1 Tax=Marinobacter psychrophilus TaxID=330734 RepID=A0A0H4I5P1_9GAMM|nr:ABC transporter permease [Marinobacter psychrophilus]AKO53053.1 peptide ABC transporter permease [Marinobacter psychrophilus]